jgi:phospholipid transport system transporter-binding protein
MASATVEREGDTLRVRGELNFASVADLWRKTGPLFATDPPARIDLGEVSHSNSAGVARLVDWLSQAHHRQRELVFLNVPAQMRAIIQVADLDTVLPVA